jgi:ATP-dependent 26S proteasome regulatory subunit
MSFVDKSQVRGRGSFALRCAHAPSQLEPGCSVLMHNKGLSIVGILSDEVDPLVSVMKARQRGSSRSRALSHAFLH